MQLLLAVPPVASLSNNQQYVMVWKQQLHVVGGTVFAKSAGALEANESNRFRLAALQVWQ